MEKRIILGTIGVSLALYFLPSFISAQVTPSSTIVIPASAEVTAKVNGLQVLDPGSIAVVSQKTVNDGTTESMYIDGRTITFSGSGPKTIIESHPGITTYVGTGPEIKTYAVPNVASTSLNKSATDVVVDNNVINRINESTSSVPVIIEFASQQISYTAGSVANSPTDISAKIQQFKSIKARVAKLLSKASRLNKDLNIINGVSATIDRAGLKALENNPDIKKVELDGVAHVFDDASNAVMNVPPVWSLVDNNGNPITGLGETIAIIDTGVDYTQSDLGGCIGSGCKVMGGYNFISNNTNTMDDYGHGTHVASIAAGRGVVNGVAPDAKILSYKVCDSTGSCPYSAIIQGLGYAMDPDQDRNTSDHANVANLSLGGDGSPDDALSLAVDNATAAGVTVVVAAGNSGPSAGTIESPGTARTAITVAASCMPSQIGSNGGNSGYCTGPIASFSSRGPLIWNGVDLSKPDISAPGVWICGTQANESTFKVPTCVDNKHILLSGTSMATPQVAGAAALVLQAYPGSIPSQVKQILKSTATSFGSNTSSSAQGAGLINVQNAIPVSSHVSASPSSWSTSTDPTSRYSTSTEVFSVSAAGQGFSSLSVSSNFNIPGISATFNKTTLNVSSNATDTLVIYLTADNNIVHAGTYSSDIVFSSGGINEGFIPVFFTVAPTISVSPISIDFGNDNPATSTWTSSSTVTVTNLRSDTSQTLLVTTNSPSSGILFTASSSIAISASGSNTLPVSVTVNNATVPNGIYGTSTLTFTNTVNSPSVSLNFMKYFVLNLVNNDRTDYGFSNSIIWVHNYTNEQYLIVGQSNTQTFYLNTAGPYDALALSECGDYGESCANTTVLREGIDLSTGIATVTEKWTDAIHKVTLKAEDESGNTIVPERFNFYNYYNNGQFGMLGAFWQHWNTSDYYSNISSNYIHGDLFSVGFQPAKEIYTYYGGFHGLGGDMDYANTPNDLARMDIQVNASASSSIPILYPLYPDPGPPTSFVEYDSNQNLNLPTVQTIYSDLPPGPNFFHTANITGVGCSGDTSKACASMFYSPIFDPVTGQRYLEFTQRGGGYYSDPLPPIQDKMIYNGLGPSIWFGSFANSSSSINLSSYITRLSSGSTNLPPLFVRQDYSLQQYDALNYTVKQNGITVASGTTPSYLPIMSGATDNLPPSIALPGGGPTQFNISVPYKDSGHPLFGKVEADFDTTRADPNPPSIKRLYFYSNGERSEVFDPTVDNQAVYELDPAGGAIATTSAGISTDGINFIPITITSSSSAYVADIPAESIVTTSTSTLLRVTGTDDSGNILKYTFGLPISSYKDNAPTVNLPSLFAYTPTAITQTSATLHGFVTDDGGASSTMRGFQYGPTSTYGSSTEEIGKFGNGTFSANISSLNCGTTYFFAAYVVNSAGTSTTNSNDSVFTTSACSFQQPPPTAPSLATSTPSSITQTSATLNASVTNINGASTTVRGFYWGATSNYGATTTESGTFDIGPFSTNLSSLICNAIYHYAAYAANSAGTSTTEDLVFRTNACSVSATTPTVSTLAVSSTTNSTTELNGSIDATGGSDAIQHGFIYGTDSALATVISTSTMGSYTGMGYFSQVISNLNPHTTYYDRAYAQNSAGMSYGAIKSFTTLDIPSLSTSTPSSITQTSATLNANVTNLNGASTTVRGFYWGATSNYGATTTESGTFDIGPFSTNLLNLTCNTTYHYAAYAVNSAGTSTTPDSTFTTSACPTTGSGGSPYVPPSFGGGGGGGGSYVPPPAATSTIATSTTATTSPIVILGCPVGFVCTITPSTKPTTIGSTTPCTNTGIPGPFNTDMSSGMDGSDILALQNILSTLGFFNVTPNGHFGPATLQSVISYQTVRNISATGYVGSLTRASLNTDRLTLSPKSCSIVPPSIQPLVPIQISPTSPTMTSIAASSSANSSSIFTRDLDIGSEGPDVKALQQYLNTHGFIIASSGPGSPFNETTLFGSLTQAALAKFQQANNISPAIGYFGPLTRAFVSTH